MAKTKPIGNPANRRYRVFYVAGMPAELAERGTFMEAKDVIGFIQEEYPGQKSMLTRLLGEPTVRRGDHWAARRFIIICVQ